MLGHHTCGLCYDSYDAADAALWIGEIPDHVVTGGSTAASTYLRSLFEPFGDIVSVTVRTKQGVTSSVLFLAFLHAASQAHHSILLRRRVKELGHFELLYGRIGHARVEGRCYRRAAESRDAGSKVRLCIIFDREPFKSPWFAARQIEREACGSERRTAEGIDWRARQYHQAACVCSSCHRV